MRRFEIGHAVRVEMSKWGSRPHWHWTGFYLGTDEHGDWLGYPVGTRYARPGKGFIADFAGVGLVPGHHAAHLTVFNSPSRAGANIHHASIYIDIATPPVWDGAVLRAIDLDLDVVQRQGRVAIIDQDEFVAHQLEYGYPPELIALAEASARDVHAAVVSGQAPYEGTAERWFEVLARVGDA